ncbi:RluA family pseudouridine synthase [Porphyromonas loveana]|uniref:RluA family pseudouridine synthase n=1 Tax=Porphyromonas loveana TaxID=1884669 RepID=UPI00359F3CFC
MEVVYEDNHLIIVNKAVGEIVQGDKTGDSPLSDTVKQWIKEKYAKPGNVFLGVTHRLDRPVAGLVVFAKTGKALSRLNNMFRDGEVQKVYRAIVRQRPPQEADTLVHYIRRNEKLNKSFASLHEVPNSKKASLSYRLIASSDTYHLLEIALHTGRHHQIRCQLAAIGCPIKGDLKYGFGRSNPDGGISLVAHRIRFTHPVSGQLIDITAPLPKGDKLWPILFSAVSEK